VVAIALLFLPPRDGPAMSSNEYNSLEAEWVELSLLCLFLLLTAYVLTSPSTDIRPSLPAHAGF